VGGNWGFLHFLYNFLGLLALGGGRQKKNGGKAAEGLKKISRAFRSRRKGIKSAAKERSVNVLPLQNVGVLPVR